MRKGAGRIITVILMLFVCSCSANYKRVSVSPPQKGRWVYMGNTEDNSSVYLNKEYVRFDQKIGLYKAIIRFSPSLKQQKIAKKQIEDTDRKASKEFNVPFNSKKVKMAFDVWLKNQSKYCILTTTCKDNKFTIHFPLYNNVVKANSQLSKKIYNFVCDEK